jgi:hypothetical protein
LEENQKEISKLQKKVIDEWSIKNIQSTKIQV